MRHKKKTLFFITAFLLIEQNEVIHFQALDNSLCQRNEKVNPNILIKPTYL